MLLLYIYHCMNIGYSTSILFGHEEAGASALGHTGSREKVGSCPNKMLALYDVQDNSFAAIFR
jgi:hypothetical protein